MSDRWTLNPEADAAFRHWDGETVTHHRLSNDTHRLADPAGWCLARVSAGTPLSFDQIASSSPYDATDLSAALDALCQVDLLRRC